MQDEDMRARIDLSFYRLDRAFEDLATAKELFETSNYRVANNRAYYAIFHSLRAVMVLDQFDSKKHSGIISEFRRVYIKQEVFPKEISKMIESAFIIRNASDYDDMFIASKDETAKQIENAEHITSLVKEYLGSKVDTYQTLFEKEGENADSQIINLLLVSLFSSDTLLTPGDCIRSERELMKIKWAISDADISDEKKSHWSQVVDDGIEICRRDYKELVNGSNLTDDET